jgi:hypothetical protein
MMTNQQVIAIMAAILAPRDSVYDEKDVVQEAVDLFVESEELHKALRLDEPDEPDGRLLTSMTPEWCMKEFHRVNPGAKDFAIPSLYLVDFARAVVRHMEQESPDTWLRG